MKVADRNVALRMTDAGRIYLLSTAAAAPDDDEISVKRIDDRVFPQRDVAGH